MNGPAAISVKPNPAPPCTIVIFGAKGDLTKRLLMPAIYNLAGEKLLDDRLSIIGLDHNQRTDESWRAELAAELESFTTEAGAAFHPDHIDRPTWDWVAQRLAYTVFDFENAADYAQLKERLPTGNVIFYLAVGARFFGTIVEQLGGAGLLEESDGAFRRVVVEKPFGSDFTSARALNARILAVAGEKQIYRIDHFMGKEPVQGIMPLRFSNGLFEPMWVREHIDAVQITASETLGIEGRGKFYEATGALRDMVPNHLFSLLTMVAMESPDSFDAEAVRNEKVKLLNAIHPIAPADAVRGQYASYRDEANVAKDSRTETYVALKLRIDNRRWSGVPFYLRTGKRLAAHSTTITIHFRPAQAHGAAANVLRFGIDPFQGLTPIFSAKEPGPVLRLAEVCAAFSYRDFFVEPPAVGYETLLYHVMTGNALLFQREDMVEASWRAVQPVLDAWSAETSAPGPYVAGSNGPAAADELLGRDGNRWQPLT